MKTTQWVVVVVVELVVGGGSSVVEVSRVVVVEVTAGVEEHAPNRMAATAIRAKRRER